MCCLTSVHSYPEPPRSAIMHSVNQLTRWRSHRECNSNACAVTVAAFADFDPCTVLCRDLPDDGEAQAAAFARGTRNAVVPLEHAAAELARNSRAFVGDRHR